LFGIVVDVLMSAFSATGKMPYASNADKRTVSSRSGPGKMVGSGPEREVRCSSNTISAFETDLTAPNNSTLAVIRAALSVAGVEFIPENGGGAGVRLKKA
jgi:hypothetical protein